MMRTREEIEEEAKDVQEFSSDKATQTDFLILEVLLDIREQNENKKRKVVFDPDGWDRGIT